MVGEDAIGAIYDSVFSRGEWNKAAAASSKLVDCGSCLIQVVDLKSGTVDVLSGHGGVDALGVESYQAHYHKVDNWKRTLLLQQHNRVQLFHEMFDAAEFERSEIFRDWVYPQVGDSIFWAIGSLISLWDADHVGIFAMHRAKSQGAMNEDDRARIQQLVPHVRRAMMLGRLVETAGPRDTGLQAICDNSPVAAMLVDDRVRIVYSNAPGQALLSEADRLRLNAEGTLCAATPRDTNCLHRQVALCCGAVDPTGSGWSEPLRIAKADGTRALIVTVGSVPESQGFATRRMAILFAEDIWRTIGASAEKIRSALSVTAAEARLVAALSTGLDLKTAAGRLGISYNTARTHIQNVLAKTGLGRQSELLVRVARLV